MKIMSVFELVVPFDNEMGRRMKEEKYNDLFTNMTYQVQYRPFAVGSVTGFLENNDQEAIKALHQFCKEDIELDQILFDVQSLASKEFDKLIDMLLEDYEKKGKLVEKRMLLWENEKKEKKLLDDFDKVEKRRLLWEKEKKELRKVKKKIAKKKKKKSLVVRRLEEKRRLLKVEQSRDNWIECFRSGFFGFNQ